MRLTPTERDRLLHLHRRRARPRRRARGLQLNAPEATALIADTVIEAARDGQRLRDAVDAGCNVLEPDDVLPGVADLVPEVWVEAVFDDGTRLVVVPEPLGPPPWRRQPGFGRIRPTTRSTRPLRRPATLEVHNTADVPISVTSHFHFFEVNPRLALRPGSGLRHAPGHRRRRGHPVRPAHDDRPSGSHRSAGERVVIGFAGLVDGPLDAPGAKEAALAKARATGYLDRHATARPA